jgi:hypothetical protein
MVQKEKMQETPRVQVSQGYQLRFVAEVQGLGMQQWRTWLTTCLFISSVSRVMDGQHGPNHESGQGVRMVQMLSIRENGENTPP